MRRLPLRVRLTLVFALAMAVVLVAVGAFVYFRLGASLDEQLDESLQARAAAVAALVSADGSRPPELTGDDESFAQLLGPAGDVEVGSPGFEARSLLSAEEHSRARTEPISVRKEKVRLLARPVERDGRLGVVVVGGSLEDRQEALDGLLAQLLVAGPIALLLSSALGYLLAGGALRPVEAMRRRAAEISAATPDRRLPLPESRDEVFRLGETLNRMLQRLEDGLRRERRFVADASHELRTPLALLQAELELALRRPRAPEELEQALRSAGEEVERLVRLAEDLLVLASAQEGRLPLRRAPLAIDELLESVAGRFTARAGADGRALEVVGADGHVDGDRLRLEQALGNLVDNALRYGAGTVRLEARSEDGSLLLRVSDEGTGFPPAFLSRAFERFSRADEARARGAAGLGLAIVDAVARAHGGKASASNRAGGGAEVTLAIPADG